MMVCSLDGLTKTKLSVFHFLLLLFVYSLQFRKSHHLILYIRSSFLMTHSKLVKCKMYNIRFSDTTMENVQCIGALEP